MLARNTRIHRQNMQRHQERKRSKSGGRGRASPVEQPLLSRRVTVAPWQPLTEAERENLHAARGTDYRPLCTSPPPRVLIYGIPSYVMGMLGAVMRLGFRRTRKPIGPQEPTGKSLPTDALRAG